MACDYNLVLEERNHKVVEAIFAEFPNLELDYTKKLDSSKFEKLKHSIHIILITNMKVGFRMKFPKFLINRDDLMNKCLK